MLKLINSAFQKLAYSYWRAGGPTSESMTVEDGSTDMKDRPKETQEGEEDSCNPCCRNAVNGECPLHKQGKLRGTFRERFKAFRGANHQRHTGSQTPLNHSLPSIVIVHKKTTRFSTARTCFSNAYVRKEEAMP